MKTFKFFAALMMAVVCVGLSSCNKDDEDNNGNSLLVGTWVTKEGNDILVFSADGTLVNTHYDGPEKFVDEYTYFLDKNSMMLTIKLIIPKEGEDLEQSAKIKIDGNALTVEDMVYYKQ